MPPAPRKQPADRLAKKATAKRTPAKKTTSSRSTSTNPAASKRAATSKSSAADQTAARARRATKAVLAQQQKVDPGPSNDERGEEVRHEHPDGMPGTRPFISLGRRERARWMRVLSRMQGRVKGDTSGLADLDENDPDAEQKLLGALGAQTEIEATADLLDLMADIGDLLTAAAVDAAEMEAWVNAADDATLMAGWAWYQQENPMGEASASPS